MQAKDSVTIRAHRDFVIPPVLDGHYNTGLEILRVFSEPVINAIYSLIINQPSSSLHSSQQISPPLVLLCTQATGVCIRNSYFNICERPRTFTSWLH